MLRKKDLSKQFELVVQQEIKEHNKAVLASNLAVNKLGKRIDDIYLIVDKNQSILENKSLCTKLEFNNNLLYLSAELESLKSSMSDAKQDFVKSIEEAKLALRQEMSAKAFDSYVERVESKLEESIISINKSIEKARSEALSNNRDSITYCDKLKATLQEDMSFLKEEVVSIKGDIVKDLKETKIDKEGLLKEIKVLKKLNFINEKKIENLYTLIDRLTKVVKGE